MSFDEGQGRYCVELDVSRDETSTSLVREEASSSFTGGPLSRDTGPFVGKAALSSGGRGLFVCPRFMRDQPSPPSLMRTQCASFTSVESGEEALMTVEAVDVC